MPEKDQFSSTMRIDIPPELLDNKAAPAAPAPPPEEPAQDSAPDEQGDFTSTMRIDIPPDSLVQSEVKRATVETTTKVHGGKTVIHIPKKKAEATPCRLSLTTALGPSRRIAPRSMARHSNTSDVGSR